VDFFEALYDEGNTGWNELVWWQKSELFSGNLLNLCLNLIQ
jgi:hypothetical protein